MPNLTKDLRTFLNKFEVLMILADGPIILEYQAEKLLSVLTL